MPANEGRLGEPDYQNLAYFRHLFRRFLVFSEEAAREAGLKPQQHQLLLSIKGLPSDGLPTIGALAWQLQLKHHTVVELVDRLSALGLVRRNRNVLDHREVLIEVTPAGDALLRSLSVAHRAELRRMAPLLLPALTAIFESDSHKEHLTCPTPTLPRARSATSRRRRASSRSGSSRSRSAPSAPASPSPS
ncbi:MAG TPA: MarR family winged helix-turn-helix transcriptional regulator [Planctomycetota bacterium]|nr:MarR family winged helix-turn-helix transcriptional regulator [Planctomycetota bacterium]